MSQTSIGSGSGGNDRVAPAKLTRASSAPSSTSGSTPTRSRMPRTNSSAFSASRAADVAQNLMALTSCSFTCSMYSSTALNTRCSEASAIRPVRSTPWPSRTMRISRTTSSLVPDSTSRSATRSRNELVPQSKAATRVMESSASRWLRVSRRVSSVHSLRVAARPPSRRPLLNHRGLGRRRARLPPFPELVEHLVAERVDPTALRQRLAREHVQALHPVGHAAGGDARDLGHLADLGARCEIGLVRPQVRRGELLVLGRAVRSSRASGRMPRGCRSSRPPAGRSGRRSSGTAFRRRAAARSRRRRGSRTGSGGRPRGSTAAADRAGRQPRRRRLLRCPSRCRPGSSSLAWRGGGLGRRRGDARLRCRLLLRVVGRLEGSVDLAPPRVRDLSRHRVRVGELVVRAPSAYRRGRSPGSRSRRASPSRSARAPGSRRTRRPASGASPAPAP